MSEKRVFQVGDMVVYKPYEGCDEINISDAGIVEEVLGNGMYKVRFGLKSMHGTRLGTYCFSNLWEEELQN